MVWAGTSTGRGPQRPESRCATKWRSKNGDRGPGISERKLGESSVMFLIDSEGGMIDSGEETIQSGFNFRGVGNFTFNGRTGHLGVVISWLVGERARESSLQTGISGGGADGFSDAISERTCLGRDECVTVPEEPGVGQVCCTPQGWKVKAAMKYCVERGTVSVP